MTLAEKYQQTWQSKGSTELFLGHLMNAGIIDIGVLEQVYVDNIHGLIQLFNDKLDQVDAELCLISGLGQIAEGQIGLVIYPKQSVEIATKMVDTSQPPYSSQYAKFIPLSVAPLYPVKVTNTAGGVSLGSEHYSLCAGEEDITIASKNLNLALDTKVGSVHAILQGTTHKFELMAGPEGITAYAGDMEYTLSKEGIVLKGNVTIDGDVAIKGNFSAGDGNFTVDK